MSTFDQLRYAIDALEAKRAALGDAVVDAAIPPMCEKLLTIERETAATGERVAERKQVTVMFADLSGFTALSETKDAEHVRSLVNDCFNTLVPIIEAYGGVVDKFIGDAIMALFGAPIAHENDAERALRAALDMMKALKAFDDRRGVVLDMHFGIATGRVVAGGLGSDGHQQYSVIGDAVNVAARLEDLSEPGEILVGPVTHHLTRSVFRFDPVPSVSLKGKSRQVAVHRLLGPRSVVAARGGTEGLRSPMIGRESEMQAMHEAAQGLARGHGGSLAIIGEAGIGKSRLVAEARGVFAENFQWVLGHAVAHAHASSYALASSLLDNLVGAAADSSPAELTLTLREFVRSRMNGRTDDVFPYLARMRELPLDPDAEQRLRELLPEALQARIHNAFAELIRACAAQQPIVLVCEDVHWSDPSSLGLLEALNRLTAGAPLLLLLVFRPDEGEAWQLHRRLQHEQVAHYRVLELSPLERQESSALIDELRRFDDLPDAMRELILAKADGNPFFLEELLQSLIDGGFARGDGKRIVARDGMARLDIPDTVQGVVAARIDRLPADAKRVLQTASVLGRLFPTTVLESILRSEGADTQLNAALGELVERELVRPHGASEYAFKHAITREVAYESLLLARRKVLHNRTAETMERVYADRLDELAATLAHHLVSGETREKAVHYLTVAADRARETYANAEATQFYQTAIQQVDKLREESANPEAWGEKAAALRESIGGVLSLSGRVDEALEAYEAARRFLAEADAVAHARLYRRQSIALSGSRRIPEMLAVNERAVATLGAAPHDGADQRWWQEWTDLQLERVWGFYLAGRIPEVMELVAQAGRVIEQRGTPAQHARLLEATVLADLRRFRYFGLPDETLANAVRQLDMARTSADRRVIARGEGVLGFVHLFRNELSDAEQHLGASLEHAEYVGDMEVALIAMNWLAFVARHRGDVAMARHWAERTVVLSRSMKNLFYQAGGLGSLGWAALHEGDEPRAEACLEESMAITAKVPSPIQYMAAGPLLALSTKRRDWRAAIGYAQALLHPSQRRLPDEVHRALQDAIDTWNDSADEHAAMLLVRGVDMLRERAAGYV